MIEPLKTGWLSAMIPLLVVACGDQLVGPTEVPDDIQAGNAQNRAPLTVEAVFLGAGGGIVEQIVGQDQKYYEKGTRYGLYVTLVELHGSGEELDRGSQTVLLAETTLLAQNGRHWLVGVAWEETEGIANGSLIRACAQIIKIKEDKDNKIVSDLVCEELEPTFPD